MMGALRDFVAILLLVVGPVALVVAGVVILVNELEAPVARAVASISGDDELDEVPSSVPVVDLPSPPPPEIAVPVEPAPPPGVAKKRLVRRDVLAVVQRGRHQLLACAELARERAEVKPGRLNLAFDFTVAADGSVESARLLRPKRHRKNELGLCATAIVSSWRFPASEKPTRLTLPVGLRVE